MKPIILNYAIKRKGEYAPVYEYDYSRSLNVIKINDKRVPFIDSNEQDLSMLTKTKVYSERDDEGYNLLELKTKTEVRQEKDDDALHLLELQTKTFVKQESDD